MYLYIYDTFLNQSRYGDVLKNIENSITQLGLNGAISRFDIVQKKLDIENKLKQGLKTIIVVGDDSTVNEILGILIGLNLPINNLVFGIIPIGKKNYIADRLGIEIGENACKTITKRIVKKINVGVVNNKIPFLVNASIKSQDFSILIDKQYSIDVPENCDIKISNLNSHKDGELELIVKERPSSFFSFKKGSNNTTIYCKKAMLRNNNLSKESYLILDTFYKVAIPAKISISKQKIIFIMGKDRKF